MKILHCINSPHIGGIERLVINLAIAQQKSDVDVSIMLNTRDGQYYNYLNEQGIPILDSNIKGGFDLNLSTYKALKHKFNTFQIIHMHSFSPICALAAKHSSAKIVYTIHGLSKGIRKENKIKYALREFIKSYALNTVDALIANSQHTLTLAKKHYGLNKVMNNVVLNGIKLTEIENQNNFVQNEYLTIGLVSRFTHRKRIDRLVNAFDQLLKKEVNAQLILVGDGVAFESVKNHIGRLNLSHSIDLIGYSENVDHYYQKFDVCVHPSDNEGFGLVAVEAYINGKPVIAFSDSGGLVEVIKPLDPKNIVNTEDELTERLFWYSHNKNEISKDKLKRINYVKENFSIERMERQYFNVYKKLN